MSGDILNFEKNVEDEDGYEFTESVFKNTHIIIDDNTKMQLMKMQRTPKSNIDEKQLNNPINKNVDEKRD